MSKVTEHEAILGLAGAVIKLSIIDYQNKRFKKHHNREWKDAKEFLFYRGRLEEFLDKFEATKYLNCKYLRHQARYKKMSHYDYNGRKPKDEL